MLASLDEHQLLVFYTQIFVLVLVARLLGALMRRFGQPSVVGELAAGIVLGPSVFAKVWPGGFEWFLPSDEVQGGLLVSVGWIGVILLLVVTGFDTDLGLIRRFGRAAALVATGSLVVPFVLGLGLGFAMPELFLGGETERLVFALFIAAALSISSLPVIAKILSELNLMRRNFGQITLAAGMANDVVGWLVLGVIAGLATSGTVSLSGVATTVAGMALFLALAFTVGQRGIDYALRSARRSGSPISAALATSLLVAFGFGVITQALGVEAVLGAFIAGILLGRSRFQTDGVLKRIESITMAVFAPLFFATAGLRIDLALLADAEVLLWSGLILLVAGVAKFAGSLIGARSAGLGTREGVALGAGLNARGALEIIIATVGLSLGVLNDAAYTAIVLMAIATSLMAPPLLRLAVHNWQGSHEEQRRLEREEAMSGHLVVGNKRLLLPSRGGPNSIAAAQILHFAWPPGAGATVLSVRGEGQDEPVIDPVVNVFDNREHDVVRVGGDHVGDLIFEESKLGYGVIGVGVDDTQGEGRLLSPVVDDVLSRTDLPVVIVRRARNLGDRPLPGAYTRALVPVTGSPSSRAAQEIAFHLSEQLGTEIVLAHVVNRPEGGAAPSAKGIGRLRGRPDRRGRGPSGPAAKPPRADKDAKSERLSALALGRRWGGDTTVLARPDDRSSVGTRVLDQALALADEFGVRPRTVIRTGLSAAHEIVTIAMEEEADLVVLGATLRKLDARPFLGHTVEHVLEGTDATVVVVTVPRDSAEES